MKTLPLDKCLKRLDKLAASLSFDQPPCVVIVACPETRPTALAAIRCLGRRGVPVIAVAAESSPPSFASRFAARTLRCPDQKAAPDDFITFLVELGKRISPRPALQFCSDYDVALVCSSADRLRPHYDCPFLSARALRAVIDKSEMVSVAAAAGFEVPHTALVTCLDDAAHALDIIPLPAIVKPVGRFVLNGNRIGRQGGFIDVFHRKGLRCATVGELRACLERAVDHQLRVLVQEEIPGGPEKLDSLKLYADKNSEPLAFFYGKKVRQFPSDFGSGTLTVPRPPTPDRAELAARFVKHAGHHGIASFEWKLDDRDGEYKFMEINPRVWSWTALCDAVGVNLPYIQYLEVTGQHVPRFEQQDVDVRWVELALDIRYFLRYRKGDHTGARLPLRAWLRSLRGRKEFAYFGKGDRRPGFVHVRRVLGGLTRRAFRKVGRILRRR